MPSLSGLAAAAPRGAEWLTRNRVVALCVRYGHNWEAYSGSEMNGPYVECSRCGEMSANA